MTVVKRRAPFISTPPQPATSPQSPPPPPAVVASSFDYRRVALGGAVSGYASLQLPNIPPQQFYLPPVVVHAPATIFLPGGVTFRVGGTDSISGPTAPVVVARGEPQRQYPGSVYYAAGPGLPVFPKGTPAVVARESYQPPPAGRVFFAIGSGDLNPLAPGRPAVAYSPYTPLPGSAFASAQHTDTLLQTPSPVIVRQSYTPIHPGWSLTAHALIDNGDHRIFPTIACESPRRYPAGFAYAESGMPDNGLSVVQITIARTSDLFFQVTPGTGKALGISGSIVPPVPPPTPPSPTQVCEFTADLTPTVTFSYDFDC